MRNIRYVVIALLVAGCIGVLVVWQTTGTSAPPHIPLNVADTDLRPEENAPEVIVPEVSYSPEPLLGAELELLRGRMRMSELARRIKTQLGAHLACHAKGGERIVHPKPGIQTVRDLLATITAAAPLTAEVLSDGEREFICFWRKPDAQMLAEVMKLARSDDVLERCTGAHWLGPLGGRQALVQLLAMLADSDARVRYFASSAIVGGWDASGVYSKHSASSPVPCVAPEGTGAALVRAIETEAAAAPGAWRVTRWNMLQIASQLRDPIVLPVLKKQLEDMDGNTFGMDADSLYFACAAIGSIGGPEAEAILLATLDRLTPKIAQKAMPCLGVLGTDGAIARLGREADAEMPKGGRGHFRSIVRMIASSDSPAAAVELIRLINHPGVSGGQADFVARILPKFDTPEAHAACLAMLRATTDPTLRIRMGTAMANVPAVRDELFADLGRGGAIARSAALALVATGDPRLMPVLVEIINADAATLHAERVYGQEMKSKAMRGLSHIDTPEALQFLLAAANEDTRPRAGALFALGNFSAPEARKTLRKFLQGDSSVARKTAAKALAVQANPADVDVLVAAAKSLGRLNKMSKRLSQWDAVAAIGGERAAKALQAAAAKGNVPAVRALTTSRDPYCIAAVRDGLAGGDARARSTLLRAFDKSGVLLPSAYYAATAALAELPKAEGRPRANHVGLLGWTRDPRGTDVLGKMLVSADESALVRKAALGGLSCYGFDIRWKIARSSRTQMHHSTGDPAALESMRHAYEKDADERMKKRAKNNLVKWGVIAVKKPLLHRPPEKPDPQDPLVPKDPPDEREFPQPPPLPDV